MRTLREPKPGKAFELMDAVIGLRAGFGIKNGITTVNVAAPRSLVITSTQFEDLDEVEALYEGVFASSETKARWERAGIFAKSTHSDLSRIVEPLDGLDDATYVQRYIFSHDSSSRRPIIDALVEMREQAEGAKVGISASMNNNSVIATRAVRRLVDLESAWDRLRDDPGTIARATSVLALCTNWRSSIAKIVSRP
jgi:hypothetical protein